MNKKRIVADAYEWSYDRYVKDDPELIEFAKDIRVKAELAQQIYDIRNKLRMTREDLAEFADLTSEAIEDLEESDYEGDWNEAIDRINRAFHHWFTKVIVPAARMKPDEYSIKSVIA
jgi:DNA-binding XRE family transcriptional regulator